MTLRLRACGGLLLLALNLLSGCNSAQDSNQPATGSISVPASRDEGDVASANFAFCDGSVRFLKDTISTWALDANGSPLGAAQQANGRWMITDPTLYRPGVYQSLGSINGGEAVSADSY